MERLHTATVKQMHAPRNQADNAVLWVFIQLFPDKLGVLLSLTANRINKRRHFCLVVGEAPLTPFCIEMSRFKLQDNPEEAPHHILEKCSVK